MPDAQIGHIRESHPDTKTAFPGSEGHFPGHILQNNSILIEKSVAQIQPGVFYQRIPFIQTAQIYRWGKAHSVRLARLGEGDGIILKGFAVFKGHPETGVTADPKGMVTALRFSTR